MKLAPACVLAACSTGGVSLSAQREWLPSHEISADDLSALHFTAYSPDPAKFEGYRQYPPGGYVVGGTDGHVEIPDVPDGSYTLQVAYADHSDWYGYDTHTPAWLETTVGRRDQVAAPVGTLVDLRTVTLGEAWTLDAQIAAMCANTNSALDSPELLPMPVENARTPGAFDWDGEALIDGSAGDALIVLHRTEVDVATDVGAFPGTIATEMFAPPPFTQTPGAATSFTGSFTPLVAATSASITPALFAETEFWTIEVSVGPGTADGVPGVVLAEFSGAAVPDSPISITVADPFDPSWPLLTRSVTQRSDGAVVVAIGDADVSTAMSTAALLIDGEILGPEVSWGGAQPITFSVDADVPSFELDLETDSTTIHVYSDAASILLPREALSQDVQYNASTIIGSGAVTTHQAWIGFQLIPF